MMLARRSDSRARPGPRSSGHGRRGAGSACRCGCCRGTPRPGSGAGTGYVAWAAWPRGRRVGMINLRRAHGVALSRDEARRAVRTRVRQPRPEHRRGHSVRAPLQALRPTRGAHCTKPKIRISLDVFSPIRGRGFSSPAISGRGSSPPASPALSAGRPGAAVVRRIDNPFLNALWRRVRVRRRREWIEKHGATSEALARLRRGEDVAMLLDEHGGPRGVFVPFFGTRRVDAQDAGGPEPRDRRADRRRRVHSPAGTPVPLPARGARSRTARSLPTKPSAISPLASCRPTKRGSATRRCSGAGFTGDGRRDPTAAKSATGATSCAARSSETGERSLA